MEIIDLLKARLVVGHERYGKGLLHADNDRLDFRQELLEEVLDMVLYSAADCVRKTPQVTAKIRINDDGAAKLSLTVNYEMDNDGNDAVLERITHELTRKYEYSKATSTENDVLDLGLLMLQFVKDVTPGLV